VLGAGIETAVAVRARPLHGRGHPRQLGGSPWRPSWARVRFTPAVAAISLPKFKRRTLNILIIRTMIYIF
jgi:hypothetical protein